MDQTYVVFVYGTLRKQEHNHHFLADAKCIECECWTYGKLYDTGYGYPAMVKDQSEKVYGELYKINEDQLKGLNQLEGYIGDGHKNNLYDRVTQEVYTRNSSVQAFVYIYASSKIAELKGDSFSDWKRYRHS